MLNTNYAKAERCSCSCSCVLMNSKVGFDRLPSNYMLKIIMLFPIYSICLLRTITPYLENVLDFIDSNFPSNKIEVV